MSNKFSSIIDFCQKYKWLFLSALVLIIILSGLSLKKVKFNNNIELMLPEGQGIQRSVRFLKEAHFSDKIVISFSLNDSAVPVEGLIQEVDKLSGQFDSPMVIEVIKGFSQSGFMEELLFFLKFIPQTLSESDLSVIDREINPQDVKSRLNGLYRQLISPGSTFMMPFIRQDPLGINIKYLRSLEKLSASLGYDVILENGHFLSRDKKHALLILRTSIPLTDGFGCRKLVDYIQEKLKTLPGFISADIIAGHMHSLSNEQVIKDDIQRTTAIAAIAFLLVFLIGFRDPRSAIFFLIPLSAVVMSLNITAWIFKEISYFVAGMGAVIVGIADDYGIHVYFAVRVSQRRDIVKNIAKPLFVAAMITNSIFFAFFFSSVKGYHQLAFFSILSILLCFMIAIFVFPSFISTKPLVLAASGKKDKRPKARVSRELKLLIWVLIIFAGALFSLRLKFNNDVGQFDGSDSKIFQAEDRFHKVWGGYEQPAFLVVQAEEEEEALFMNDIVYEKASNIIGSERISSFSSVWPSYKKRVGNVFYWNKFWEQGRKDKLKKLFALYASDYGFSADAFSPFFDNIYINEVMPGIPDRVEFLKRIKDRFVVNNKGYFWAITFFPDREQDLKKAAGIAKDLDGAFFVSRKGISSMISEALEKEIVLFSIIAVALIIILTLVLLRDFRFTIITLIPVVTALTAVFAGFVLSGKTFNTPAIIASMVVVGLCIDYGVFLLHSYEHDSDTGTDTAIWVSVLTTIIGAAALLFAKHPVLFSIGFTLTIGLLSGYIATQSVMPIFYDLLIKRRRFNEKV